jgi:RNA polymerase sigma factor (sigma-70 family)
MDEVENKHLFLVSHLPLVKKHARAFLWCGAPFDELYHVGWLALVKAIKGYNPEKFQNGLTAYAIHWIKGDLRRFVAKKQSLVTGRRTERGKFLPHTGSIEHFGNVAVGDGTVQPDVSLHEPAGGDGEDGPDDEPCSGYGLDNVPDYSMETTRGDFFWERRTRYLGGRDRFIVLAKLDGATLKEIGLQLGISAERVRQLELAIKRPPIRLRELDEYEWNSAQQFYYDCKMFCQHGIGYFYRDRRPPPKCRFPLLPYEPPRTLVRITEYAPREWSDQQDQKVRGYELTLINNPPPRIYDYGGQDEWTDWKIWERQESKQWKLSARTKLKAEHQTMFWPSDSLSDYEIWSEPSAIGIFYAKGSYPYRVPYLTASHTALDKNGKPIARSWWSPFVVGECDYGRDQRAVHNAWAAVGESHKRRVSRVGQELVLKGKINTGVIMKKGWRPDPKELKHGCYWKGKDPHEKDIHREVCAKAA